MPADDSQGNRCFRLLYGCALSVKFCRAGSRANSGQMATDGVPSRSTISSSWAISVVPGINGLWSSSSPRIQPIAHMSMAVVCVVEPSSSSGARYHSVTTRGVIGRGGMPNFRASPKSAAAATEQTLKNTFHLGHPCAIHTDFDSSLVGQQDVGYLQVAVHDEVIVQILETL